MAARKGDLSKQKIIDALIATEGFVYKGEENKKHFFEFVENGEKIQVAVSLSIPTKPINVTPPLDWSDHPVVGESAKTAPLTNVPIITDADRAKIEELKKMLAEKTAGQKW